MTSMGKACQTIAAGGGFFLGFLWGVSVWAGGAVAGGEALVRAALVPGALLACGYATVLAGLFWADLPVPRLVGLRAAVGPAAFTLSVGAGHLGIRGTLWLLGS